MRCLKNPNQWPPGGWNFEEPFTGFHFRGSLWGLNGLYLFNPTRIRILVAAFGFIPIDRNLTSLDFGILLPAIALCGNFNDRGVYNRAAFGINALGFQFG